jgi:DNA-binding CsgD family transcriptional regulator
LLSDYADKLAEARTHDDVYAMLVDYISAIKHWCYIGAYDPSQNILVNKLTSMPAAMIRGAQAALNVEQTNFNDYAATIPDGNLIHRVIHNQELVVSDGYSVLKAMYPDRSDFTIRRVADILQQESIVLASIIVLRETAAILIAWPGENRQIQTPFIRLAAQIAGLTMSGFTVSQQESTRTKIVMLSARELEVLRLIARGYTNRDIGRILGVKTGTIRTHVEHIIRKLHAQSRTDALAIAMKSGVLTIDDL